MASCLQLLLPEGDLSHRGLMLPITIGDVRLFLHVLGAAVWVGGQIIFSALVPVLRRLGTATLKPMADQLTRILWAGFALLIVTGIWNLYAVDLAARSGAYHTTLAVKLAVVALSGVTAWLHTVAAGPRARAAWGATTGVTALVALLLGVVLAG
jgi:putative copper export protein